MKPRLVVGALLVVVASIAASSALAADTGGFTVIEGGGALFPDRAYVVVLDKKRPVPSAGVSIAENGKTVRGITIDSAGGVGTVLLIDASNSMKPSINQAMAAARQFAAKNPGTPLSVVTFNSKPRVVLPFTTDRKAIAKALSSSPPLAEGTRIWDALSASQAQIRGTAQGAGRIVLLSDGDDVGSTTTKDAAIASLEREKVRVFAVGIASPDFTPDDLQSVADATGGTYALASSRAALSGIYTNLGAKLSKEFLLRYRSSAAPGTDVKAVVVIKGLAGPETVSYTTPSVGSAVPYQPSFIDRVLQSWLLMVIVVLLIVGLLVFAASKVLQTSRNRHLRRRLSKYVSLDEGDAAARKQEVEGLLMQGGGGSARLRFSDWDWTARMEVDLELANIKRTPQSVAFFTAFLTLVVALVCGALFAPIWALLGIAIPFLVRGEISRRARKSREAFADQLPDNLEVLGSALRAGHSLAGAMAVVVDESPQPSRDEFRRIVTDEQLGIPLDETLELTARRMDNQDMEQVAVVALLQRDAGGNMAEVLDRVIENIRARQEILRLVRTLTAQGRLSRWILSLLPVFVLVMLLLVNPDHLQPLFHRLVGQIALVVATIMVIIGSLVISKIVKIKV